MGWKRWIIDRIITTGGLDELLEMNEDDDEEAGAGSEKVDEKIKGEKTMTKKKKLDYLQNPDALGRVARRIITFSPHFLSAATALSWRITQLRN